MAKLQSKKDLPVLDIVRFMEISKYKSLLNKPSFDLGPTPKFWSIKPPIGMPPPCERKPVFCVKFLPQYMENILVAPVGKFTIKIKNNKTGKVLLNEKMVEFKEETKKYRIYSIKNKIMPKSEVSLELSCKHEGKIRKITLPHVKIVE